VAGGRRGAALSRNSRMSRWRWMGCITPGGVLCVVREWLESGLGLGSERRGSGGVKRTGWHTRRAALD
jgi:hypothetical protein